MTFTMMFGNSQWSNRVLLAFASISCFMMASSLLNVLLPPAAAASVPSSSPNMEGAGAAGLGRGACPLVLAVAPEEARCVCGPAAAPTEGPAVLGARLSLRGSPCSSFRSSVPAGASISSLRATLRARSICALMAMACRSFSSRSAPERFSLRSSSISSMGSRWMSVIHHPFSVSSTLHLPSLPRYLTNSVRVSHLVAFM
mmetsp:Transcript_1098/g.2568  ORF Transcript_1098/g.2568 Transcript_1098/m.2568 type:complete len:200 (-) Transcript_1098:437-1036(-)